MTSRRSRLHRRLARAVGRAVADYRLIAEGDRILCAISGGKDSFVLHELLVDAQRRAPVRFEVVPLHVEQGLPGEQSGAVERWMAERGYRCRTVVDDTYSIVQRRVPQGETRCALCARLRRAVLYRAARELHCNKVALGHHRDDLVATLMLNLLFVGQLKAMPPRLCSDDGAHVVIRPLSYCAEEEIAAFAAERRFAPVSGGFCGEQQTERDRVAELLRDLEQRYPGVRATMLAAAKNVRPSHLLDAGLWRSLGLPVAGGGAARG